MPLGWHYCCLLGGTTVAPFEVTVVIPSSWCRVDGGAYPFLSIFVTLIQTKPTDERST